MYRVRESGFGRSGGGFGAVAQASGEARSFRAGEVVFEAGTSGSELFFVKSGAVDTLVPVGEKQFLFMVSEAPYFALSVMRVLARRRRQSNETV